jgi:dTDP-4-dehydrorhamnose 3,5-epimerase
MWTTEAKSRGGKNSNMSSENAQLDIPGLFSWVPQKYSDSRGYFLESYNKKTFTQITGLDVEFVQDNESLSSKNVLRGLHFQIPPFEQGKLVRVLKGRVLDVAVDLRKNSAYYGKHLALELSAENGRILWIPPGFAHGFLTLEDNTVFHYKCSGFYHRDAEKSLRWNDPVLNINWGVQNPVLSEKDAAAPDFKTFDSPF